MRVRAKELKARRHRHAVRLKEAAKVAAAARPTRAAAPAAPAARPTRTTPRREAKPKVAEAKPDTE